MRRSHLAAALGLSLALAACDGAAGPPVASHSDSIIAGDTVTHGSMQHLGPVKLDNGCSGTLLTNRHVITAKHCVRNGCGRKSSYRT
jgi:Trypsin